MPPYFIGVVDSIILNPEQQLMLQLIQHRCFPGDTRQRFRTTRGLSNSKIAKKKRKHAKPWRQADFAKGPCGSHTESGDRPTCKHGTAKGEDGLRLRGVSVLCSAGAGPGIVPPGGLRSCWTWGGDTVPGA